MPKRRPLSTSDKKIANLPKQIVGNAGLFYVSYCLSLHRWNVMPTSRNARGIDILIYNPDCTVNHTLQVKALSDLHPVLLGRRNSFIAEYVVVCAEVKTGSPRCFILTREEAEAQILKNTKSKKKRYRLPTEAYAREDFEGKWERILHANDNDEPEQ